MTDSTTQYWAVSNGDLIMGRECRREACRPLNYATMFMPSDEELVVCVPCGIKWDGHCEKLNEESKEEEEVPYCYADGKYSAPIPCGCPQPCCVPESDDEEEEEDEDDDEEDDWCECCFCSTELTHKSSKMVGDDCVCVDCYNEWKETHDDEEEEEDDIVFKCSRCDVAIIRDSEEHDNCRSNEEGDVWWCMHCTRKEDDEDEEDDDDDVSFGEEEEEEDDVDTCPCCGKFIDHPDAEVNERNCGPGCAEYDAGCLAQQNADEEDADSVS
jgi:hypothetical protein